MKQILHQNNFFIYTLILLPLFFTNILYVVASKHFEPIEIVELQSAGILPKGFFDVQTNLFTSGGVRMSFRLSPLKNINLGLSFGGTNIIGTGKVSFQNLPGVLLKFRPIDEKITFPAISFGFSTQGFGPYNYENKTFETFSEGIFAVASKSFTNFLGYFDTHLGINYSFEPRPKDRKINLFVGISQEMFNILQLNLEYNTTLADTINMKGKGLLNFSAAFWLTNNLCVGLILKDLTNNIKQRSNPERNLMLRYIGNFLPSKTSN
ncbi:MAG: hypothetical protein N2517_07740 [Ignavibacteria bacterium]|nr:hypothetical protein [Ignavibacteria bacterium]